jgi:hypothetical protein
MRGAASSVGLIDNGARSWHIAKVNAELIRRQKAVLSDGAILELVIWRVPNPVEGSGHKYKYRLYYGREGQRIVGYDNEWPKGDHRHLDGIEEAYTFTTVENLVRDFLADVERRRTK